MMKLQGIVSELYTKKVFEKAVVIPAQPKKVVDAYVPNSIFVYGRKPKHIVHQPSIAKKFFIVGAVTILLGMTIVGATRLLSSKEEINVTFKEVMVSQGDTYWHLVRSVNPDYAGDIRPLIHYAEEKNNGQLKAFSTAIIPVVKYD